MNYTDYRPLKTYELTRWFLLLGYSVKSVYILLYAVDFYHFAEQSRKITNLEYFTLNEEGYLAPQLESYISTIAKRMSGSYRHYDKWHFSERENSIIEEVINKYIHYFESQLFLEFPNLQGKEFEPIEFESWREE